HILVEGKNLKQELVFLHAVAIIFLSIQLTRLILNVDLVYLNSMYRPLICLRVLHSWKQFENLFIDRIVETRVKRKFLPIRCWKRQAEAGAQSNLI
ncbi:unnamed protein product, partial [Amoebophrya sp. A25]